MDAALSNPRVMERARMIAVYMAQYAHCRAALALQVDPINWQDVIRSLGDGRLEPAHVTHEQAMLALRESARREILQLGSLD